MLIKNPLVMVPGPTPITRSIQDQMGRETISFNDPRFVAEFNALIREMEAAWRCDGLVFVVAGSGTMAMEMGIANIAGPHDNVLVCSNGHFGDRYIDICSRKHFKMEALQAKWGESVSVADIDKKLSSEKFTVLVVTHIETSTAVELPLKELTEMLKAKHPEVLLVVDGVASAGAAEFYMDWGIDIMLTCSQKGFGISPGIGICWASQRAIDKRQSMGVITESYVDFEKWIPVMKDTMRYWGTPAVNMIWALKEGYEIIKSEGIPERAQRHIKYAKAVRAAVTSLGFKPGMKEEVAACTLSVFLYPDNFPAEDAKFRQTVYDEGIHIAGCLGDFAGKGFRIGHMSNIDAHVLINLIAALERACVKCGYKIEPGAALSVMQKEILAM